MELKLTKFVADHLGETKLRTVGLEYNRRGYQDYFTLDLADLTKPQLKQMLTWLEQAVTMKVRGAGVLVSDMKRWEAAMKDAGGQRARTVNQFSSLLTEYLRTVKGHRIYRRCDDEGAAHIAYYVNTIKYEPENRSRDYYTPACCNVSLLYYELGGRTSSSIHFESEDIRGMTASEALVKQGYFPETPDLRKAYLAETKRWNAIATNVGVQFLATGTGTSNLDGNPQRGFSRMGSGLFPLDRTKVVMDVFYEEEKENHRLSREGNLNDYFWGRATPKALVVSNEEALDEEDDDITQADTGIEVPIHPFCATFDLRRHLRLRVHVNYLTDYKYDTKMGDKLILPAITKNLVATLIAQSKIGFADIIEGKGQGVTVLLGGKPGTGKTLTAEVFAEASKKPLYSVQAAQLGIRSDSVEENLTLFLKRGARWDAIVLIDEADVYIMSRDRDMEHNAIVAAMLRVLEYQTAVMFLTTNLPDTVDDAVISRCIARINYDYPSVDDQKKIWRVLADLNGITMKDATIKTIVKRHSNLAGRDIKQLLKLAALQMANSGRDITPQTIDFVATFQPTIKNTTQV